MNTVLLDRKEAGVRLAERLTAYENHPQATVLGLPRGGVPVAYEIASNLQLPLNVCLVRKLGLPQNPEVAIGAVVEDTLLHDNSDQITIVDRNTAQNCEIDVEQLQAIAAKVKSELRWRDNYYRHHRPMLNIGDRVIILVDDGIATGLTMQAAVKIIRRHQPKKVIVAVPVASNRAIEQLKSEVDEIVCLLTPQRFNAVSFWYRDFPQVTDREVCELLSQNARVKTA